jgi:hypothetical protein
MADNLKLSTTSDAPWMVTQVPAQLDAMAGACNELYQSKRQIMFIVPIASSTVPGDLERPISYVAIFTLPMADENK